MENNTERELMEVVAMSDFEEAISGLAGVQPDVEASLLNYITKTRNVIASKPQLIENQQDANQMLQMYDYLLANWHTENRIQAIQILASKERELLKSNHINYDFSDLQISDISENAGFFSVLEELFEEEINELNGFFSRIGNKIKHVAHKVYDVHKNVAHKVYNFHKKVIKKHISVLKKVLPKLNRVNPLTIAVRNALRGLIAINFLGMATSLGSSQAKQKGLLSKVQKMYKNMGGKNSKLMSAIAKGKRKKPLFNRKMQKKLETGKLKGLGELGEPFTIGGMLVAAGGFLLKIWNWIKKAGLKVGEISKKVKPIFKKITTHQQANTEQKQDYLQEANNNIQAGKTNDLQKYGVDNKGESSQKEKSKKLAIAVVSVIGISAIGYGIYALSNKDKNAPKSKLSGITLQ